MSGRLLTIRDVAERLERHVDRIEEGLMFGEIPVLRAPAGLRIRSYPLPPRRQVSEEEG
jgi:hypothetical protein